MDTLPVGRVAAIVRRIYPPAMPPIAAFVHYASNSSKMIPTRHSISIGGDTDFAKYALGMTSDEGFEDSCHILRQQLLGGHVALLDR